MTHALPPKSKRRAWEEHAVSQLEYFRSLTLREKLQAIEGMADIVRRLQEMRARGELQISSDGDKL